MVKNKRYSWAVYTIILLFGLACIFGGNLLSEASKLWGVFVIEIGIAFMVALIIIFTIERHQREHQNEFIENSIAKISSHLFNAAYKKFIPDEIFTEFVQCLSRANVIRSEHKIYYEIQKPPAGLPGHVICVATSRYKLTNVAADNITHDICVFLEKPLDRSLLNHCMVQSVKIDGRKAENQHSPSESEDKVIFKSSCSIPEGGSITVVTKSQLIKLRSDVENWSLMHPSTGITLSLSCDPALNLSLHADSRHSKNLEVLRDDPNAKEWALRYGTFPHQSVVMWWSDKT